MSEFVNIKSGYRSGQYARAFIELGEPRYLAASNGWIIRRKVPESSAQDGMGIYPLFCCSSWDGLSADVNGLRNELISLALVTDTFGAYDERLLKQVFSDLVVPFKSHFIADLSQPLGQFVSSHHRYYGRKAHKNMDIFQAEHPRDWLADWIGLYRILVQRHDIRGIADFSQSSFRRQFEVPGMHLFIARRENEILGMQIWYRSDIYAYHHLSAYSADGYRDRASYGLLWFALDYFQQSGIRRADLGASAGLEMRDDGLSRFKAGWCNDQRVVYLCGKVFDKQRYLELTKKNGNGSSKYFPAYRQGEFV